MKRKNKDEKQEVKEKIILENSKSTKDEKKEAKNFRYGPMPRFPTQRVWSRTIVIAGVMVYIWYSSVLKGGKEIQFAKQKDMIELRSQSVDCDRDYLDEVKKYPGCYTKCGRFVTDQLVTAKEAHTLLQLSQRGFALGGSDGGASILDLHSGALSHGTQFVNIYTLNKNKKIFSSADWTIYKIVRTKIQHAIAEKLQIDSENLYLTHPTFFSKLTNKSPKTVHDEYWHIHVDKETYESFHYTSLLYLSDYGVDFKGGKFVFVDNATKPFQNVTIEPRKGRVSFFTSGAENPHFVEPVTEGTRYAITISFTCDKSAAIKDPDMNNKE